MSSIREQIVTRVVAALTAAAPGAGIYRSREIAITRAETPAIVVVPENETSEGVGEYIDRHHLEVLVEIITRGDPWDSLADPVAAAAHKAICTDATLLTLCDKVRKLESGWAAEEADQTAGALSQKYRFTYTTDARDITVPGQF